MSDVSGGVRRGGVPALGLLLPFLRPYLGRVLGAAAALLLAAGLTLAVGQGLRHIIDDGFGGGAGALNRAAMVMGSIVAALGIATACRYYLVTWLGERVAADLRRAVFDHLTRLDARFFEVARTGDLMSRLTADVALLQSLIGSAISMGLRNALTGIGAFAMLVLTSAKLAGLMAVVVPLVLLPMVAFGRRERRLSRAAQERVADLAATAEEAINAMRIVQAFTHEDAERARYGAESERSVQAALRRVLTRSALILSVILLGFGAITFALWVGGQDVIAGRMSGGDLTAFVFYAVLLASAGATVSELWGEIQRAAAAADRLAEILAVQPAIAAPANPVPLPAPRGRVTFRDVTFRYPSRPEAKALDRFGLDVAPGETVALVGPSGAGKTTVLALLLRFYDPTEGAILIDGVEIARAAPEDLRRRIGLVPQDPVIFSATVAENIRYGRPGATDAEVRAAAEAASALGFIEALPEGFATHLGARGVTLSGGQRQRVAIARAILRDAPVLLLDEATSALDAESEHAVQQALARASRGRTTLVVAHRLATVRRADRIVVMEAGRIVATGTHEALLAEGGLYARLAALQFTDA
ncbi:ABC transporter transmembrane domain-containing protein [Neoroseomonas oryzicola]|uniref:ATP-binding cassette domain-containing protein n=1 Tax=Neoroseomonas oryzicola TaxID=535904 RepID=A0A9X9WNA1_9PROT|nr:ABC transporter transmembrane domain-containing protein [Neoroseomonas oryzicola]MBR0661811.1 ATP-binding cassette domain-containing protein [Neoroseomonas oryzicola]NKE17081.1 ATP-binding cassette domain-containing protein [Neoroseomonas oryzicola]